MPPAPPPSPAGNEFPPVDTSWSRSALSPTPELPTVWRVEQVLGGAGMWQSWGNVIEYQTLGGSPHRDVRPGTSPAPPAPVEERIGSARLSLTSSRVHAGEGFSLTVAASSPSSDAAPGRDLGEAAFLGSPTAASRLLRAALRASKALAVYRYRLAVGDNGSWLSLRPGDQVTVTDAGAGFSGALLLVSGVTLSSSASAVTRSKRSTSSADVDTVDLDLVEQSAATFGDSFWMPELVLAPPAPWTPPAPSFRSVSEQSDPGADGTVAPRIRVELEPPSDYSLIVKTKVQWRRQSSRGHWLDAREEVTRGWPVLLEPVRVGATYEIRARSVSHEGVESAWSAVRSHMVAGDTGEPETASGLIASSVPGAVRLSWPQPLETDYAYTEVYEGAPSSPAPRPRNLVGSTRGTQHERRTDSPAARRYWVRHVDRSGNRSEASAPVDAMPGFGGGGVPRDYAYMAQAAGAQAPQTPVGVELGGAWTRKPEAPTQALAVVRRSYREAAPDGEANLTWSGWTESEPWAVFDDHALTGFTRQVELEFRALDRVDVVATEDVAFIEPTPLAPLVQVRRRFRASSSDAFPDWERSVHRWITVGRHAGDDIRYGLEAEMTGVYGREQRVAYLLAASHPAAPGGSARRRPLYPGSTPLVSFGRPNSWATPS